MDAEGVTFRMLIGYRRAWLQKLCGRFAWLSMATIPSARVLFSLSATPFCDGVALIVRSQVIPRSFRKSSRSLLIYVISQDLYFLSSLGFDRSDVCLDYF